MSDPSAIEPTARNADDGSQAREFFDRRAPAGYLEEWSSRLRHVEDTSGRDHMTVVVFRLHGEFLALPISALVEVTLPQPLHILPHRTNTVLLGLVNIRGQLRLCVSLHGLLGVESPANATQLATVGHGAAGTRRLLIIQERSDEWVFPVEEVVAVHRLDRSILRGVPATLGKASSASSAVFDWHDHTVGLLDENRLLPWLRRACT